MRSNTIRFSGLASGMDTDSIVRDMMRPQQLKIDRQKQAQTMIQWKKDAWKEMNTKIYDFYTSRVDKLRLRGTFNKTQVTSSNESALDVVANTVLPEGTHKFKVRELAEAASLAGKVDKSVTEGATEAGQIEVTVADKHTVRVNVSEGMSLEGIAKGINTALKDKGVKNFTARYDKVNETFFLNGKDTGKEQKISIAGVGVAGEKLVENMGFKKEAGNHFAVGKDAAFTYNGIKMNSATNKVSVNGAQVVLKGLTSGDEEVTLTATQDTDAIYDWVKDFITDYNKLVLETHEKLEKKPRRGYEPLTDEERKAMSEDEIKLWETTIKDSVLYRDEDLSSLMRMTRRQLGKSYKTDSDDNALAYNSLASLGIVTGDYRENGILYIAGDEDGGTLSTKENKLRKAIEDDPQEVINLLTTLGRDLKEQYDKELRSSKIKSALHFYNDKSMDDSIREHDKAIERLEERMHTMEDRHYAKFAAMEKMLSQLNSQGNWLAQQMGGGQY